MDSARGPIPGLSMLRSYKPSWLPRDVVAGLVLSALLVPQGMAYAELAGLPAVTGLYTSMLCLLGYAVFGPSRVLVLGPDSSLGPMIAATVLPLVAADGDPATAIALASMLALITGAIMIGAGLAHLGFVADLLSKPTILGYMNGLALTIVVGQLPKLLGFSVDADGFVAELAGFVQGVAAGDVVTAAALVGCGSLLLMLVLGRVLPRIPAVLVTVIVAMACSVAFALGDKGVKLVGTLPQGLPSLTWPQIQWADLALLVTGAFGIALVALADTIGTATSFAERRGEQVDGDKEMVGIGVANIAAGFFQGFPVSTSGSRTAVAEQAGAKSQITGVVGAMVIAAMLVALPSLFADLPQATLAAVVIAAALTLADIAGTRRLLRQRPTDFVLSLCAFAGVALLGVLPGIILAIALSVANVFRRVWRPHVAILGRVAGMPGFHDSGVHPEAEVLGGHVIYRFDAPLIFANASTFRDDIMGFAAGAAGSCWIIVAAEPMTDVDTTACDMLEDLVDDLRPLGHTLAFAELKHPVREKLRQYGLQLPDGSFFPTIEAAVRACEQQTGAEWVAPGGSAS
ncbi:MAG: sulfate permease [Candidatus Nanopelagicales bacterium]